jgi:gag-polypeptide of LTR copia-type
VIRVWNGIKWTSLVDPYYRCPIITTKSGKEAWDKLIAEYQKGNAMNQLKLRQQFYSTIHDPAIPVADFIEGVLSVAHKLDAIRHKLSNTEISNKILISLDNSWSPVHTMLTLQSTSLMYDEITSALKQYEANEMG